MRAGDFGFGVELDRLMAEVGAPAESDAFRADDRVESRAPYRVAPSKTSEA